MVNMNSLCADLLMCRINKVVNSAQSPIVVVNAINELRDVHLPSASGARWQCETLTALNLKLVQLAANGALSPPSSTRPKPIRRVNRAPVVPPPQAASDADAASFPEAFMCPIGHDVMDDPVIIASGHTYERRHIERWLQEHGTDPLTNLPLEHLNITPNHNLKGQIAQFRASLTQTNQRVAEATRVSVEKFAP